MDKIYSRNRIRIPRFKKIYSNNKKIRKRLNLIAILLIAFLTFYIIVRSITPIFEGLCNEKAISIATEIMNSEINSVLAKYNYKDLVMVVKDETNNTNVLKTDVATINKITSDLPLAIQSRFKELNNEKIAIPIGSFTGNRYLSGVGPNISIKIIQTGNVITDVKTEFESAGINQTVYRIYLELTVNMRILTSYNTTDKEIVNQVLLVETVIVGEIPETYLNLDGLNINSSGNNVNE